MVRDARRELEAARSLLFVPGADPRKLDRAWSSGADVVVLDLEDAVAAVAKDEARALVTAAVRRRAGSGGPLCAVRVNAFDTPWGPDDLAALVNCRPDAVMLPKASVEAVDAWTAHGPDSVSVIALIETSQGLRQAYEIAAHPPVVALALGGADLGAELGWIPTDTGYELMHPRSVLTLDSAAAGIRAPFDVVHLAPGRPELGRREAMQARSLGLAGKLCIHPDQVRWVNEVFSPTPDELAQAARVVKALDTALEAGLAVAVVDGKLVDAPVARRARAMLRAAQLHADPSS
ncbi:HpcH/HpaI aldolase/citrate lyase family protein [Streptomyces sp. NBC_01320]|uniref:HpcH/HpaI aldolase/citrate lyase family protein n=1 Tax=Streptomyces sp. NBC_01320 TaxID=2903824 RepID=UPI002E12C1C7|nr:CoA ester lyase [Streptomyces sp. NBC_01320]